MPGSIPALTDQSSEALTNQDASLTTQQNRYDCVNTICVYKSYNGLTSNIKKKDLPGLESLFPSTFFTIFAYLKLKKKILNIFCTFENLN